MEMSQDVFDFFMIVIGIGLSVGIMVIGLYVIDRSRRSTPFYHLGYAAAGAWASTRASDIQSGRVSSIPYQVGEIDQLAADGQQKAISRLHPPPPVNINQVDNLKKEIKKLQEEKEELDRKVPQP